MSLENYHQEHNEKQEQIKRLIDNLEQRKEQLLQKENITQEELIEVSETVKTEIDKKAQTAEHVDDDCLLSVDHEMKAVDVNLPIERKKEMYEAVEVLDSQVIQARLDAKDDMDDVINNELLEEFEKNGLKIDKERVLTYSQLSCPLNCKYCFVDDMNFNQSKNVPYLTEKQKELLKKLPDNITLIMLGCDTEFLQNKENALEVLIFLSELKRDISLITKLPISDSFIDELAKINEIIRKNGNSLTLSISITSTKSSKILEPNVPSPQKRVETLKKAYNAGLQTMVAIRPLVPVVSDDELEEIISETKEYCIGYYSGHLYLKDINNPDNLELLRDSEIESKKLQPHWMPNGNEFELVKRNGQMEKLKELLKKYNKPLFEGAAEGVTYIKEHNL